MGKHRNGEGSVYQRKDGRWVDQYLVYLPSDPKYRYIYAKNCKEAARRSSRRRWRTRTAESSLMTRT